jgi:hypothetical protein
VEKEIGKDMEGWNLMNWAQFQNEGLSSATISRRLFIEAFLTGQS